MVIREDFLIPLLITLGIDIRTPIMHSMLIRRIRIGYSLTSRRSYILARTPVFSRCSYILVRILVSRVNISSSSNGYNNYNNSSNSCSIIYYFPSAYTRIKTISLDNINSSNRALSYKRTSAVLQVIRMQYWRRLTIRTPTVTLQKVMLIQVGRRIISIDKRIIILASKRGFIRARITLTRLSTISRIFSSRVLIKLQILLTFKIILKALIIMSMLTILTLAIQTSIVIILNAAAAINNLY